MPDQDQLSTAVIAFERWRSNRNGRQVPTPTTLREQAVSLLNHYSSSQIISALSISGSQLKQWRNSFEPTDKTFPFVHLPISPSLTNPSVNVELRFASGEQVFLSGVVVNSDMIVSLIGAMKP
jgi:hypothetical protein